MKRLTILATLLFAAVSVSAQDYHIKLWDNTTAPTSNGVTGDEYERKPGTLTNTSSAEIWIYKPAPEKATGPAIVFCPGGGYSQALDRQRPQYLQVVRRERHRGRDAQIPSAQRPFGGAARRSGQSGGDGARNGRRAWASIRTRWVWRAPRRAAIWPDRRA